MKPLEDPPPNRAQLRGLEEAFALAVRVTLSREQGRDQARVGLALALQALVDAEQAWETAHLEERQARTNLSHAVRPAELEEALSLCRYEDKANAASRLNGEE